MYGALIGSKYMNTRINVSGFGVIASGATVLNSRVPMKLMKKKGVLSAERNMIINFLMRSINILLEIFVVKYAYLKHTRSFLIN